MTKDTLIENLAIDKKTLAEIAAGFDLRFIVLHGSFAKGRTHPKSDVDIAVLPQRPIDFKKQLALHIKLQEVFGKDTNIDSKTLSKADPLFRYYVVRDGLLLYGNLTDYNEYKAISYRMYEEARGLFDLEKKLAEKFQKHLMTTYAG
jgi:predicted nucleotidyltransferase